MAGGRTAYEAGKANEDMLYAYIRGSGYQQLEDCKSLDRSRHARCRKCATCQLMKYTTNGWDPASWCAEYTTGRVYIPQAWLFRSWYGSRTKSEAFLYCPDYFHGRGLIFEAKLQSVGGSVDVKPDRIMLNFIAQQRPGILLVNGKRFSSTYVDAIAAKLAKEAPEAVILDDIGLFRRAIEKNIYWNAAREAPSAPSAEAVVYAAKQGKLLV